VANATGTSIKGVQSLIVDGANYGGVAVRLAGPWDGTAKYQGFISVELYQDDNYFQVSGSPLWYQGVILPLPYVAGQIYVVVANWRYSGLSWNVDTF
jgi:hypothetical protein